MEEETASRREDTPYSTAVVSGSREIVAVRCVIDGRVRVWHGVSVCVATGVLAKNVVFVEHVCVPGVVHWVVFVWMFLVWYIFEVCMCLLTLYVFVCMCMCVCMVSFTRSDDDILLSCSRSILFVAASFPDLETRA